jgi:outer membrane protein assembly factor BamB
MRDVTLLVGLLAISVTALRAQDPAAFFEAARGGDLDGLKTGLEKGIPIDSVDQYGITALAMAASNGQIDIVRFLLSEGADPDIAENFYYSRPVDAALFSGHIDVADLLLRSGADSREEALEFAVQQGLNDLARTAVESGPLYETELSQIRSRQDLDPDIEKILAKATSRPDPEPPSYTVEELHAHTGIFEGWDSETRAEVTLREGDLLIAIDGQPTREFVAKTNRRFRTDDRDVEVVFFGRAGLIEGFSLSRADSEPERLRRSVAEPISAANLSLAEDSTHSVDVPVVNWPTFRGANGSGIGDGTDTPERWNLESGELIRWRIEVPGLGNSSPVIWEDKVFITTAIAKDTDQAIRTGLTGSGESVDEAVPHRWLVVAYDKANGQSIWETEVGAGVPLTQRHFKATQANSTPATDGRYVVVVFPTAGLACLDLNGNVLWRHDLGGLNAGAFTDPNIQWGYASSPIIIEDMAILQVDIHDGAYLAAWDLETGRQLWRTEREVAPSWATPSLLRAETGNELIVNGSTIHGYDPKTGQELWSLGPNSELVIATPVVGNDVVYVSAGYPPVKPIYAVRAGTRGQFEVEPGTTHESLLWSHQRGGAYMPSPILYRGLLFVVHHNGRMVVYDARSGTPVHKSRFSKGGVFTASPIAVNGKLYAPTEEGLLYVLSTSPEFGEIAVNDMGEPLMATPAVSEGILIVRTPTSLTAIAHESN